MGILSDFNKTTTLTQDFEGQAQQSKLEKMQRDAAVKDTFQRGYSSIADSPFVDDDGTLGVGG